MRFMLMVKADKASESGVMPTEEALTAMGLFNEQLVKAGVLLDAAGLQPSSKGARIAFVNGKPQVTDGPFAETKELLAGYWLLNVNSKEEALQWATTVPFAHLPSQGRTPELELRQLFDIEDFPDAPAAVVELEKQFTKGR